MKFLPIRHPQIGLPNFEWIEILNSSDKALDLSTVKLVVGASELALPEFTFLPNEYLIICDEDIASEMEAYGTVVSVSSFPSYHEFRRTHRSVLR